MIIGVGDKDRDLGTACSDNLAASVSGRDKKGIFGNSLAIKKAENKRFTFELLHCCIELKGLHLFNTY